MSARSFNSGQRVALYIAAGGRCTECGAELEPGWHADHEQPYSRGGLTDVINGQALCPPCNLRKGNKTMILRKWQTEALARMDRGPKNFLAVATPGSGKTTFALTAATRMLADKDISRVIVVVPTAHLKRQWATAAAGFGIALDDKFVNGVAVLADDFQGATITYAAVAVQPLLWCRLCSSQRTLVILDEVHHAGDHENLSWGLALKDAFEPSHRRLLLSGTPFRSDGTPIPFVTYDSVGRCVADYSYSYGDALGDGGVVRPIEFLALNGEVRWRNAGSVEMEHLDQVNDADLGKALASALGADGEWIPSVLRQADEELSRHRCDMADAGGLVIAGDQASARRYAEELRSITGEAVVLAVSDEPDASKKIARFVNGKYRWLVAVKMVSEGVDIPRLCVGVYATNTRSKLFVTQVVGRFVRSRGVDDESTATLFIPSIQPLLRFAAEIERTVDEGMLREVERAKREAKETGQIQLDLVEPLASGEATHHSTILAGASFDDAELQRAAALMVGSGLPSSTTPAQAAQFLRNAGMGRVAGTATVTIPPSSTPLKSDQKTALRRTAKNLVGKLHHLTGTPYPEINAELKRLFGSPTIASVSSLEQRVAELEKWIEES